MNTFQPYLSLLGRVMLSAIFIMSGLGKISAYAGTQGYMEASGVPGLLLPVVIALEVIGGLAILVGYQARIAAFLVGGFTLLAGFIFHSNFADQTQMIMFMKNVSIAGALFFIVANGAGALALDNRKAP